MGKYTEIKNKKMKQILNANPDFKVRAKNWVVSYNKRADMLTIGGSYTDGSYYVSLDDGVLMRVDLDNKILGFTIENAKFYLKRNPEYSLAFSYFVYPIRTRIVLPLMFISHLFVFHTVSRFNRMKNVLNLTDMFIGKALSR